MVTASLLRRTLLAGLYVLVLSGMVATKCRKEDPAPVIPGPGGARASNVFAIIGDYGHAGRAEDLVARRVRSWNPAYIVTTGDNNYNRGEASTIDRNIGFYYHDFIGNYRGDYGPGSEENRFFPCLGNHDVYTDGGAPYLHYFTLPGNERYYQVRRGPVEFFILNSTDAEPDGTSATSRQARWLEQALAASGAPWKVVVTHHPPYSSGSHGNAGYMQWPYADWGADLVVAGHDHTYERLLVGGLPYLVNGLGGRSRYEITKPVAGSQVRYNASFGALKGRVDSTRLSLTFITIHGKAIDSLVLAR